MPEPIFSTLPLTDDPDGPFVLMGFGEIVPTFDNDHCLLLFPYSIDTLTDEQIVAACRFFAQHYQELQLIVQIDKNIEALSTEDSKFKQLAKIAKSHEHPSIRASAKKVIDAVRQYQFLNGPKSGYIYLLHGNKFYKIGCSKQVDDRIRQFSPMLPFPVEIVHTIATNDMYWLESELHKRFADKRTNGEWFTLDPGDVEYITGLSQVEGN